MAKVGTAAVTGSDHRGEAPGLSSGLSLLDPRILPFAAYMACIAIAGAVPWLARQSIIPAGWQTPLELWLYPLKTVVVAGLLLWCWPRYEELKDGIFSKSAHMLEAVVIGLLVYAAWVRMDWSWAVQGTLSGYDPSSTGRAAVVLLAIRLFGAAVVVPVMEELFWRSFLIRYVDETNYSMIHLGRFTVKSCAVTVILFGLEHQLWLAGMMAGAAYNLLLYRTKRLWPCIVAHGTTNLMLGIHVLLTGEWKWW